jgi:hypothetical protein
MDDTLLEATLRNIIEYHVPIFVIQYGAEIKGHLIKRNYALHKYKLAGIDENIQFNIKDILRIVIEENRVRIYL